MDRTNAVIVIARAVHEAIRAFQAASGENEAPPWPEAGEMQRLSCDAVEFALSNPTPGAQHEQWAESKRLAGWSFGEYKSSAQRTHPSLVPYEALSETERQKDALLIAVVQALAPVLGVTAREHLPS